MEKWVAMKLSRLFYVLLSFTLYLFVPVFSSAQTGTTSVRGSVLDKSRSSISGAKVTLANPSQGFERETTSSATGEFEFLALPPGTYVLTVEKNGFGKYQQNDLQLLVNVVATVTATLQVGSVSPQVEVS